LEELYKNSNDEKEELYGQVENKSKMLKEQQNELTDTINK